MNIRGTVDTELTPEFARVLGRAYATLAIENKLNRIGIGHDCRLSSPGYAQALAEGMAEEGIDVVLSGMGPTPQLYFSVFSQDLGGWDNVAMSGRAKALRSSAMLSQSKPLVSQQIRNPDAHIQP